MEDPSCSSNRTDPVTRPRDKRGYTCIGVTAADAGVWERAKADTILRTSYCGRNAAFRCQDIVQHAASRCLHRAYSGTFQCGGNAAFGRQAVVQHAASRSQHRSHSANTVLRTSQRCGNAAFRRQAIVQHAASRCQHRSHSVDQALRPSECRGWAGRSVQRQRLEHAARQSPWPHSRLRSEHTEEDALWEAFSAACSSDSSRRGVLHWYGNLTQPPRPNTSHLSVTSTAPREGEPAAKKRHVAVFDLDATRPRRVTLKEFAGPEGFFFCLLSLRCCIFIFFFVFGLAMIS